MIPWKRIETVLLDLDGTLLDLRFDDYFWRELVPRHYARQRDLSDQNAKDDLFARFAELEGRLEWYCLDFWSRHLGLDLVALKTGIAELICVLPHVTEFLDALRKRDVSVILVTNAHPASLQLKMEKTRLDRFFDALICSHRLGVAKEDPRFWGKLQRIHPFRPQRSLLVDDSLRVLHSAQTFGIRHLVAISKPNSTQPERNTGEFPVIPDLRPLVPGNSKADGGNWGDIG